MRYIAHVIDHTITILLETPRNAVSTHSMADTGRFVKPIPIEVRSTNIFRQNVSDRAFPVRPMPFVNLALQNVRKLLIHEMDNSTCGPLV